MYLPDHGKQTVGKNAVALRTADPAVAHNAAEGSSAAFAADFFVFPVVKEFMDNVADPVPKPGKQIATAKLSGAVRAQLKALYLSV